MRHLIRLGVALIVAVLSLGSRADACTCVGPRPACETFWQADVVFLGRVTSVDGAWSESARFAVVEAFKGEPGPAVSLSPHAPASTCNSSFTSGETYVVYARRRGDVLSTHLCSGTRLLSQVPREDLAYLRALPLTQERAFGELHAYVSSSVPNGPPRPVPGVTVRFSGDDVTRDAQSDADGKLTVQVPPGRYRLEASAPPSIGIARPSRHDVELVDRRGCALVHVAVSSR